MASPEVFTVEEFWQYPGCGHYSRKEAEQLLHQLQCFAGICYQHIGSCIPLPARGAVPQQDPRCRLPVSSSPEVLRTCSAKGAVGARKSAES
jgi:hypothetical protein